MIFQIQRVHGDFYAWLYFSCGPQDRILQRKSPPLLTYGCKNDPRIEIQGNNASNRILYNFFPIVNIS